MLFTASIVCIFAIIFSGKKRLYGGPQSRHIVPHHSRKEEERIPTNAKSTPNPVAASGHLRPCTAAAGSQGGPRRTATAETAKPLHLGGRCWCSWGTPNSSLICSKVQSNWTRHFQRAGRGAVAPFSMVGISDLFHTIFCVNRDPTQDIVGFLL